MRRPKQPPRTGNALLDALREAEAEHQKEEQRGQKRRKPQAPIDDEPQDLYTIETKGKGPRRRPEENVKATINQLDNQFEAQQQRIVRGVSFQWLERIPGQVRKTIKWTLITFVTVFLGLNLDGMRRENAEFHTEMASVQGSVSVQHATDKSPSPATAKTSLSTGDIVLTGPTGRTTLTFPDGSAIELEPNTRFEVRDLGYGRGGIHKRSFLVSYGEAIARVSKFFGVGSAAQIETPTAVAAVRGTGFAVKYTIDDRTSFVPVVDGTVALRTSGGQVSIPVNFGGVAVGNGVPYLVPLTTAQQTPVAAVFTRLATYEHTPNLLENIERGLLKGEDPILQHIALPPGGWSLTATDSARRVAAAAALRQIQQRLTAMTDVPDSISLSTYDEIGLDPLTYKAVQGALDGGVLESYQKTGSTTYILRARARDTQRTLYELTEIGVQEVPEPKS